MVHDIVSDMITRIRNAIKVKHHLVQVPFTKMTNAIANVLKEENLIEDYRTFYKRKTKFLLLLLKYKGKGFNKKPIVTTLIRISKPGLRVYSNVSELPIVLDNYGVAIVSTSKGITTNKKAKELGIGGEILFYIW